ncbi:hypothetical protein HG535_0F01300 [Zygotorulaspora mrakii]|uniref:DFDF domain-containing protein n=1 Tax=Zygotorulaspora mrakii TaxID=42260 RepID=A0A7H9B6P5_ZYGMR|nr:uncharacterized protein HG535_0F01300 [Zygotorulaspora mrakii]QLG73619.1 hypothetical protein HG535_0F01300 [Zygotorulaspora mrakii]
MSQYIGKTISLISVTDNRYIGLLEDVDSDKGTVTLREVRCFGTEGRRNWGPEEIFPTPTVYKSVKFNGNEVKDLSILDCKLEDVQPLVPPPGAGQRSTAPVAPSAPHQVQPQVMHPQAQFSPQAQQVSQPPQASQPLQPSQPPQPLQHAQPQVPAAVAGYGVYAPNPSMVAPPAAVSTEQTVKPKQPRKEKTLSKNRNQDRQPKGHSGSTEKKVEIPTEDFDFQTSNAKFAKDGKTGSVPEDDSHGHPETPSEKSGDADDFYNQKSSFFDSISTSTETNTNMRWQEEKEMNLDTFGQASARPRFGGRGGHRGGRGGRGRGRGRGGSSGRGRGGYNFGNNNNNYGSHQTQNQNIEF